MTSKQRSYLKGLAMNLDAAFQIGKSSLTPEFTESIIEFLEARELVKLSVLDNSDESPRTAADALAEALDADVVAVIGKKFVLYRESVKNKRIELP